MGFIATAESALTGNWKDTGFSFFKTKFMNAEEQELFEKEEKTYMMARYNYKKYIPMKPNGVCKAGNVEWLCYSCGQDVGENSIINDFCNHCGQRTDYL